MDDVRWKQRFSSYASMLNFLQDSFRSKELPEFSELERVGIAKGFELCFELLWKLLKDYLEYSEVEVNIISPKNVIKIAATSGILQTIGADGDVLMQAHKTRNELVHVYDSEGFASAVKEIKDKYLPELIKVENYFKEIINDAK